MDTIKSCCLNLQKWIMDSKSPVHYRKDYRYYCVSAPQALMKKYDVWYCYQLTFCPSCGERLPLDLTRKKFKILKKEYGLENPIHDEEQKKRVPKEFLTDEWWKKRGL
ncbi:MAG: hypothetical protein WBQ73_00430 [Candidatus Babeliales bacterium]